MNIHNILNRLEKVKQTGLNQYVACCPAHEDKSPSLSIREVADNKILIHCFAECPTSEILEALGLSLEALFPEKLAPSKRIKAGVSASTALEIIYHEGLIIQTTCRIIINKNPLFESDYDRLTIAFMRINAAYDYYKGRV